MWTVIKFDKKKINLLQQDLLKYIGKDCVFYRPKIQIQKYYKNKLIKKDFEILGDYLFCYHKSFYKKNIIDLLKFSRGLKYFLSGFIEFQTELDNFIKKCKKSEDINGYISRNLFDVKLNKNYKFNSGPFVSKLFKIVELEKNRISIVMGNIRTHFKKEEFLFTPV
tara:strand:+ start:484 stop:981 length:498 start_codon:yes stop_codon:yes gene_type:complete